MMKPATFAAVSVCNSEDRERDEWVALPLLPQREGDEQDARDDEDADRLRRGPLPLPALRDPEDEQDESPGHEHRPWDVVALTVSVLALTEQDRREREGGDADGDVHEEDPLPREQVGEDPAREDAGCGTEAADGTPGAERDVALTPLGEGGRQDREGSRRDGRRAQALERAGDDERRVVPGETAEQ